MADIETEDSIELQDIEAIINNLSLDQSRNDQSKDTSYGSLPFPNVNLNNLQDTDNNLVFRKRSYSHENFDSLRLRHDVPLRGNRTQIKNRHSLESFDYTRKKLFCKRNQSFNDNFQDYTDNNEESFISSVSSITSPKGSVYDIPRNLKQLNIQKKSDTDLDYDYPMPLKRPISNEDYDIPRPHPSIQINEAILQSSDVILSPSPKDFKATGEYFDYDYPRPINPDMDDDDIMEPTENTVYDAPKLLSRQTSQCTSPILDDTDYYRNPRTLEYVLDQSNMISTYDSPRNIQEFADYDVPKSGSKGTSLNYDIPKLIKSPPTSYNMEDSWRRKPSKISFKKVTTKKIRNCQAIARYDNIADDKAELSFKSGDLLDVLEINTKGLEGWWLCSKDNQVGRCPGNRLRLIKESTSMVNIGNEVPSLKSGMYDVPPSKNNQQDSKMSGYKSLPKSFKKKNLQLFQDMGKTFSLENLEKPNSEYENKNSMDINTSNQHYDSPRNLKFHPSNVDITEEFSVDTVLKSKNKIKDLTSQLEKINTENNKHIKSDELININQDNNSHVQLATELSQLKQSIIEELQILSTQSKILKSETSQISKCKEFGAFNDDLSSALIFLENSPDIVSTKNKNIASDIQYDTNTTIHCINHILNSLEVFMVKYSTNESADVTEDQDYADSVDYCDVDYDDVGSRKKSTKENLQKIDKTFMEFYGPQFGQIICSLSSSANDFLMTIDCADNEKKNIFNLLKPILLNAYKIIFMVDTIKKHNNKEHSNLKHISNKKHGNNKEHNVMFELNGHLLDTTNVIVNNANDLLHTVSVTTTQLDDLKNHVMTILTVSHQINSVMNPEN